MSFQTTARELPIMATQLPTTATDLLQWQWRLCLCRGCGGCEAVGLQGAARADAGVAWLQWRQRLQWLQGEEFEG
ncbi:uncharacterized protein DS421_12g367880 [Arachis hypogaea]|nr:uncharacterized protein DS421_12g367880 [Arachis hypogaea]